MQKPYPRRKSSHFPVPVRRPDRSADPQGKGLKPAYGRVLYCGSGCNYYQSNLPKSSK